MTLAVAATSFSEAEEAGDPWRKLLDADRDEKVSRQVYLDAWNTRFAQQDSDQNGLLDFTEWSGVGGFGESKSRAVFDHYDTDNDRKMSKAEHAAFRTHLFKSGDKDNDGYWSRAEKTPPPAKWVTSNRVTFTPKGYYPEFTWDTVPLHMMFGHHSRIVEDAEVRKIASETNFVSIEKQHGDRALGGAELGLKHETAAFRKVNPGMKVLGYFNAAIAYPFSKYTRVFTEDGIAQHPEMREYLLTDPETGEPYRKEDWPFYFYNVLNPKMRAWWSDSAADLVRQAGADGIFIDQLHGMDWVFPKEMRDSVAEGVADMLQQLKDKMGPGKILLANNGANVDRVFPIADAFMFEHYDPEVTNTKERILEDWQLMEKIADAGKICIYRFSPDPEKGTPLAQYTSGQDRLRIKVKEYAELSKRQLPYHLALYLIGAQPYSYFQWDWGWGLTTGPLEQYPEFHKPLGQPLGKYKRSAPDKWEFTRQFEHASVWVDTEKREAKIAWK